MITQQQYKRLMSEYEKTGKISVSAMKAAAAIFWWAGLYRVSPLLSTATMDENYGMTRRPSVKPS
jgi:hypothetical protein